MRAARKQAVKRKQPGAKATSGDNRIQEPVNAWSRLQTAGAAILVAIIAVCLYRPILQHPFINFDDPGYVSENTHVKAGLSWSGFVWAWTSLEDGNWHPITWISHQTDAQI